MSASPRLRPLTDDEAQPAARKILQSLRKAIGKAPNLHRTLAHAPVALRAYVDTARHLAGGELPASLREQIAVATAGLNGCAYCASAHTALGRDAGVDEAELTRNLGAESADPATAAVLAFVRALIEHRGAVSDEELEAVRRAGFGDAAIVEIVAHVGMNTFTNLFNSLARTTIDFPVVELSQAR